MKGLKSGKGEKGNPQVEAAFVKAVTILEKTTCPFLVIVSEDTVRTHMGHGRMSAPELVSLGEYIKLVAARSAGWLTNEIVPTGSAPKGENVQ